MIKKHRSYTKEFRQQAMDLVRVQGYLVWHAARELGIPGSTLEQWLKKAGWSRPDKEAESQPSDPAALKVQVAALQKQVKRLEMEKEILKKATAFFASQNH
jgi:transposase-like protein